MYLYRIISRLAAVILLTAGSLKMQEMLNATATTMLIRSLMAFELLFGLWLLIGLYPRGTRILALAYFMILLNVAITWQLEGRDSCDCFGRASVRPWVAVTLDALILGALLLSPAPRSNETPPPARIQWLAFTVSGALTLLALSWPLWSSVEIAGKPIPLQTYSDTLPIIVDSSALQRVIHGVEQNHAALHTVVYTLERRQTLHAVKTPAWVSRPLLVDGNVVTGSAAARLAKTISEPELVEKISHHSYKCWVRGDEVRQDCLTHHQDGSGGEILMGAKQKCVQYFPDLRKALISTAESVDAGHVDPIDLRCAGFQPPLKSIADWLRRCQVLQVALAKDRSSQDVVRVHARTKKDEIENDVTADFAPELNYMPTRVVYRFLPDGGVYTVTDIDYQEAGPTAAWMPRKIAQRSFFRNTTSDPDVQAGQNISQEDTVKIEAMAQGVRNEDFDPILPANTLLVGDLTTRSWTGDIPVRVSEITRAEPRFINPRQLREQESVARQRRLWPLLVAMDFVLLALCLRFRKRLAF